MLREAEWLKTEIRQRHADVCFEFSTDLEAVSAKVALATPEEQLEAHIDRVALVFRRQDLEQDVNSLIDEIRSAGVHEAPGCLMN